MLGMMHKSIYNQFHDWRNRVLRDGSNVNCSRELWKEYNQHSSTFHQEQNVFLCKQSLKIKKNENNQSIYFKSKLRCFYGGNISTGSRSNYYYIENFFYYDLNQNIILFITKNQILILFLDENDFLINLFPANMKEIRG